mmetsp:Transcript_10285/g.20132  ORF Transcript_10285/g.20132 Transcript_10285/m.20132 type:complete len:122 (-) Transcript_10285:224-589(-)
MGPPLKADTHPLHTWGHTPAAARHPRNMEMRGKSSGGKLHTNPVAATRRQLSGDGDGEGGSASCALGEKEGSGSCRWGRLQVVIGDVAASERAQGDAAIADGSSAGSLRQLGGVGPHPMPA